MQTEQLLEFVTTAVIPAAGKFAARDSFVVDTRDNATAKIAWLGTTFGNLFGDTIDAPSGESELRCHRLLRPLTDGSVLVELGSDVAAEKEELDRINEELTKLFVALESAMGEVADLLASGQTEVDGLASRVRELRVQQHALQQRRDTRLIGVETTLAQLYALLERQGRGEDGVLLVNGAANIFYIRDINRVLRSAPLLLPR